MSKVFKPSPHWKSTKRLTRRQIEEKKLMRSYFLGFCVWLVIGMTVYFSTNGGTAVPEPTAKDIKKMEIVSLKLERLMSDFEHRTTLVPRLQRKSTDPQWSAENPLDRALYWLAVNDEEDRLTLQRYSLAVLYYYTSQLERWEDCAPRSKRCVTSPMLTTSAHECDWYGITCSPNDNKVTRIEWTANNLSSSGSVWPEEIVLLQELELLWWSDNPQLAMSMPTFLGRLPKLQSLSLYNTKLKGSLPESMYDLKSLNSVRIYDTQLTGSLSANVGRLSNLNWLWLHGNSMTGQLPQELADLSKLEGLTRE